MTNLDNQDIYYNIQYIRDEDLKTDVDSGPVIMLSKNQLYHCGFLVTAAEDLTTNTLYVPQSSMSENTWRNCMNYLIHHGNNPITSPTQPITSCDMNELCKDRWDVQFMEDVKNQLPQCEEIWNFIRACNYLQIVPGMQLACVKIATMVKGKKLNDICKDIGVDSFSGLVSKE